MTTSRVTRTLAAAALTAALGALSATGAVAATSGGPVAPVGHYAGPGTGYDGVIDGRAAGTNLLALAGTSTKLNTFCLQYHVPATTDAAVNFAPSTWAASGITGVAKAADVVVRHASIGTPLSTAEAENSAVQLAVWHFTDAVDYTGVPNAAIVARTTELVGAAKDATEGPSAWHVDVTSHADATASPARTDFEATVTDQAGRPVTGATVTVTSPQHLADGVDSASAVTGATGVASGLSLLTPTSVLQAGVTVKTTLVAGTVWVPANSGQKVITAEPGTDVMTAGFTAAFGAVPVVTPTPVATTPAATASPAPSTTPAAAPATRVTPAGATPKVLPHTGPVGSVALLVGLLVIATGGIVGARRTRTRKV